MLIYVDLGEKIETIIMITNLYINYVLNESQ